MSIDCDAITPDGRTLHFDDIIATGDLVEDRDQGGNYLVGLDQGAEPPRLHPVDDEEYQAWWNEQARKRDEHWAKLTAPPDQDGATDAR